MELEGNHVFNCPNCGHEHCRVVRGGRITEDRWDRRNGVATYYIPTTTITMTVTSTYTTYSNNTGGTGDPYLYSAWMDTSVITGGSIYTTGSL
jgi:hypothetical protein